MSAFKSKKFKKILSLLLASVMAVPFGATVLAACGDKNNPSDDPPAGCTEHVDEDKNGKCDNCGEDMPKDPDEPDPEEKERYITVDNIRVGLLSDTVVRVEYKGKSGFEDRDTFYVSNRDAKEAPDFTETTVDGNRVISTSNYKVYVPQNATSLDGVRIVSAADEELWRYAGETTSNVYIPSPSDALDSWYFSDSPRIVPSEYGYGISESSDPLNGWDFDNDAPDCYVFLPNGDYKQFCDDYVTYTGRSEMISLQMLGYWDSRWFAYDEKTAMQQIKDYTDRGYSIDILVLDKDWHADNGLDGVGYQINTELFPNMAEFLDECHELGINIMFNDHPEPVKGTGNLLDGEEVEYRNKQLTAILSLGLDYWWYDRNWSVSLNPIDKDISVFATGMYAFQFITNEHLQSITDLGEYADRALIMGNVDGCLHGRWNYASDISAHKYSIQWTGDINTDTTALAQEIYASVFGGAEVGIPYMSSDLGGHTASVSDDMYIRWLQYGALSTICRVHCTNVEQIGQDGRMPWLFGETAEDVVKEYVGMRYRLLPLFYALSRENYDSGLPIMRRTDIEYPQYNEASRNDQYMLGKHLLVAPFDSAEKLDAVPTEWLTTVDGNHNGLDATYFEGKFGAVRSRKIDSNVYFNWENGGPQGLGADNFSVRWEGKVKIGEKDSRLCFFADDGVRAWVDGKLVADGYGVYDKMLYTDYYAAGSEHTIKIDYYEEYGGAHVYMYYGERGEDGAMMPNTRTVFIPDGTWVDVWSGSRYTGPQTITVSHGLTTSPIFVREGSVFALAENMKNTSEKDWSNMTLDVYAGTEATDTLLYEDDVKTQAYKDGKCRKTLITNEYADGKFTVKVNPAEGEFTGDRAFTERNWTVRIHAKPEWGAISSIRVNGKSLSSGSIRSFKKSADSTPFALTGAALDGDVYQFNITADVYELTEIVFTFKNEITESEKPEYDDSESDLSVELQEAGDEINLTSVGDVDWAYFGVDSVDVTARKNTAERYIGALETYATCSLLSYSTLYASWTDGAANLPAAKAVTTGLVSKKDFALTFKVDDTKRYYVINLGGENCKAKLTLRDRAGRAQTINFGNLYGSFAYRAVIEAQSAAETEFTVTYAVVVSRPNGTDTHSSVFVSSVYVTTELKDAVKTDVTNVSAKIALKNAPATANLSETNVSGMAVVDWRHFGMTDTDMYIEKAGGDVIGKTLFTSPQPFFDYATSIGWNDGEQIATETGSINGTCTSGEITLYLNVSAGTSKILLYTGTWRATNTVRVYNSKNQLIASGQSFSAGEQSAPRLAEIDVNTEIDTTIIVRIACTNGSGNVSLAGMQVLAAAK